jgi:hypothetical protein
MVFSYQFISNIFLESYIGKSPLEGRGKHQLADFTEGWQSPPGASLLYTAMTN